MTIFNNRKTDLGWQFSVLGDRAANLSEIDDN